MNEEIKSKVTLEQAHTEIVLLFLRKLETLTIEERVIIIRIIHIISHPLLVVDNKHV